MATQDLQDHNVRIITPPGMEEIARWELEQKFATVGDVVLDRGGLELKADFHNACAWTASLRSITRVLWRVHQARCRDFPKLFEQTKKFPWEQWITTPDVAIKASARQSRLIHSQRIEETVAAGLHEHFRAYPSKKVLQEKANTFPPTTLYVRLDNDTCTWSLDLAGEALYKRGERETGHSASLRESLAFSLAATMIRHLHKKLGETPLTWLVDPMCGSGTFLQEIALFNQVPGQRQFAFASLVPMLKESIVLPSPKNAWPWDKRPLLYGFDRDCQAIAQARANAPSASIEAANIFEQQHGPEFPSGVGAAILNPPYGHRLALDLPRQQYFGQLCQRVLQQYPVRFLALLVPSDIALDKQCRELKLPLKTLDKYALENGGLEVNFWIFEVTSTSAKPGF